MRHRLEKTLLKVCTDIGWICGWREGRLERAPSACRSSRKRVMLGRALAEDARVQEDEAFRPVEAAFVSSGRTSCVQAEPVAEANGLADFAIDLQNELVRFERMGISASTLAGVLGDRRVRSLGWQLWEPWRSVL